MSPSQEPTPDAAQSAREDLAFLKGLVDGAGRHQAATGAVFVAAGLIYGLQMLGHWGQATGWLPLGPLGGLVLSLGPTALFLVVLCVVLIRDRRTPRGGTASRAFQSVFAAAGTTNLILVAIFAPAALGGGGLKVWLFYPAVVFALQGGAWLAAWMLTRRWWMGLTALGWFACAIGMGLTIGQLTYILIAAAGLLLCMVLPGWAMMRQAKTA